MIKSELTICTVSFHSKPFLEVNWRLTKYLNPEIRFKWIIIENTPSGSSNYMVSSPPDLLVFEGDSYDPTKVRPHSYHHSTGLNKAIKLVNTRFVLILDPDFYILRKTWITEIINHMKSNNLTFFGAPWNPKWIVKYRYFPCVHCMFIDLEKVNKFNLNFKPGQMDYTIKKDSLLLSKIIKKIGINIINRQYNRRSIEKSQDTGYFIYSRYFNRKQFKSECVIPVHKNPRDYFWGFNYILNKILPDRFSLNPKRSDYYSQSGFLELGYNDLRQYGWEENLWKNKPFGFHLRRAREEKIDEKNEISNLYCALSNLTGIEISNKN